MTENPFTTGTVKGDKFFGRASIIGEILDENSPRTAIYLIGSRRVGKTSLLHQISHVNENIIDYPKFFSLVWDMSGAKDLKGLINNLFRDIHDIKDQFKTIDIVCDELRGKDVFEILNEIKLKTKQKNRKLLLLCDEAEALNEISTNEPDLLPKLRHCFLYGNIKTVITANRALLQLNKSDNRDIATFLDGFVTLYLSHLDDDAAKQLVRLGSFDKNIEQEMMDRTDYHPYLLQSLCHNYYNEGDLNKAILDVWTQGVVNNCYEYDFKYFSGKEKEIIYNILDKVCIKLNDIQTYMSIQQEELERIIHPMLKLRYIIEKNNQFSIGNCFFKEWLKTNIPPNNDNNGPEPNQPIKLEAEKILSYLRFFEEMKQKGRLDEFSHDGFVTVHEFKNKHGEIEQTDMGKLLGELKNVSESDCTILVSGETGTGKEIIAKLIHEWSKRKKNPFIGFNCAAVSKGTFESEIFGYEPGIFTDALKQGKLGKFEYANSGTLFLDEIGEVPTESQAKLLRAIENKECQKMGSTKPIIVDVRIIAATNKNLKEEVEKGNFREDLHARLQVWEIKLIPLRNRKVDIPFLIDRFRKEFNQRYKKQKSFSIQAIIAAMCYHWLKNVRELRNFVERLILKPTSNEINLSDVLRELEIQPIYRGLIENLGMQQIESIIFSEKRRMVDVIKSTLENNKIDEFLQSNHLKLHQKSYTNCYKYFKAFIEDNASTLIESQRIELFNKIIIQMWEELCDWYKKEKNGNLVNELYPKLKEILCDRKTVFNLRKSSNSIKP